MILRITLIGALALVVAAMPASAQTTAPKQVVISKAVMKSMVANKPKTKTPLGARIGMVSRNKVTPAKQSNLPPTAVRAITPISKKQ